jgi:hypothetical protein
MNSKEILKEVSTEALIEYILELEEDLSNCLTRLDSSIGPILVDQLFMDKVSAVFPDDHYKPFKKMVNQLAADMITLTKLRYEAAVSGAMRWEKSQEAGIIATAGVPRNYRYV